MKPLSKAFKKISLVIKYSLILHACLILNNCSNAIKEYTEDSEIIKYNSRLFKIEKENGFCYSQHIKLTSNVTDAEKMRFKEEGENYSSWENYSETSTWHNSQCKTSLTIVAQFLTDDDKLIELTDSVIYINKIKSDGDRPYKIAASANGEKIALSYKDSNYINLYNFNNSSHRWEIITITEYHLNNIDGYGSTISISENGNLLAVGIPHHTGSGRVYIYDLSGNSPTRTKTIISPEATAGDGFGYSLKLSASGDYLIASAPFFDVDPVNNNTGRVYLINLNNNSHMTITPPATATDFHSFGLLITATDDLKSLGITTASLNSNCHETVFIYTNDFTTITNIGEMEKPQNNTTNLYSFGSSLSISNDGNRVAIGEADHNQKGAVHIYKKASGIFNTMPEITISPVSLSSSAKFGSSVDISSGNILLVGSYGANALHKYGYNGYTTTLIEEIKPADQTGGGKFGEEVLLTKDKNRLIVTSPTDAQGSIYILENN